MNNFQFLSNDSLYSFFLDGKRWPSVYHYIIASKFPSKFRDHIQKQKNVVEVQLLYVKNKYLTEKQTAQTARTNLERAIIAKFSQNPILADKLRTLYFSSYWNCLVFEDPLVPEILSSIVQKRNNKNREIQYLFSSITVDFETIKEGIKGILYLLKKVRKIEGVDFHPDMIEDVFLILFPDLKRLIIRSQSWANKISGDSKLIRITNVCKLSNQIIPLINSTIFKTKSLGENKETVFKFALCISAFAFFYKDKFGNLNIFNNISPQKEIKLPKRKRPYRKGLPMTASKPREPIPHTVDNPTIDEKMENNTDKILDELEDHLNSQKSEQIIEDTPTGQAVHEDATEIVL